MVLPPHVLEDEEYAYCSIVGLTACRPIPHLEKQPQHAVENAEIRADGPVEFEQRTYSPIAAAFTRFARIWLSPAWRKDTDTSKGCNNRNILLHTLLYPRSGKSIVLGSIRRVRRAK